MKTMASIKLVSVISILMALTLACGFPAQIATTSGGNGARSANTTSPPNNASGLSPAASVTPPPPLGNAGSNPPAGNNPPGGNANNNNNANPPAGNAGNNNNANPPAGNASNDTTPPVISNVQDNGPVYYGGNSCGSTLLTLTAKVSDNASAIKRVYVRYNYQNSNTGVGSNFVEKDMASSGGGNYTITLDMDAEASSLLNGADGVFAYQIMASDGKNNWQTYPDTNQPGGGHPAGIEIKYCGSAVGQPPPPPPSQPLTITNVQPYPDTVYYGACTGGEATALQLQATIDPLDQVQSAVVRFGFIPQVNMAPSLNYSASMYQLGIGDYAADIDVAATFAGQSFGGGFLVFIVEATNLNGQMTTSTGVMAGLQECAGGQASTPPVIDYFTAPSHNLKPGESYDLSWSTSDATCGVLLDGSQVNAVGSITYNAPSDNVYQTWTHTLEALGGADCNNPLKDSEVVQIIVEPAATVNTGSGSVYDEYSLDLGDGNGDDVIFDAQSSGDTVLYAVWGSKLAVWPYGGQPSVADCQSYLASGAYNTTVSITLNDYVCYQTGSGNYGYLEIQGMYLDLDTLSNSYVDVYYETEVFP